MLHLLTIGSGTIVEGFLQAANVSGKASLAAVYSRTRERAEAFALKHGAKQYSDDLDTLLRQSAANCVYIASPNSLHYRQAKKALIAGKHVLCEKPFVGTTAQARELFSIAEERGLFLMEAISVVHMPTMQRVSAWLERIGPVHMAEFRYTQFSQRYQKLLEGERTNVFDPAFLGGALRDLNVYNLHAMIYLFGSPNRSDYFANRHTNGVDSSGVAVFLYPGMVCTCAGAKDSCGDKLAVIEGENGSIFVPAAGNLWNGAILKLGDGTEEKLPPDPQVNRLLPEIVDFAAMVERGDREAYQRWKQHSLAVMEALETLERRKR